MRLEERSWEEFQRYSLPHGWGFTGLMNWLHNAPPGPDPEGRKGKKPPDVRLEDMEDFMSAMKAKQTKRKGTYRSSPIKRKRRSKAEMDAIRGAIYEVLAEDKPMTVRQVFYRLVSAGVIAKTEAEYKGTVIRLLLAMRREGIVPYSWVTDSTRWMRKPPTHGSLGEALRHTARTYRRALWDNQDVYVEVWTEKDAIAGILYEETEEWDVPLMVARGFSSETFLYNSAQVIKEIDRPTYLYHFGDYDPSGVAAALDIERRIKAFAPSAKIHFERAAVTPYQIEQWNLPTRPTKKTDTRSKHFEGESVEVDAIPPRLLRELASDHITQHINKYALEKVYDVEQAERETLDTIIKGFEAA